MRIFASLSRKWWFWLVCLTIFTLLIALGLWINWLTKTAITIDVNGSVRHVRTRVDTVGEVLDETDILIDPEDTVDPDPTMRLIDGLTIRVHKAAVVLIEVAGQVFPVRTIQTDPLSILAEQDITVGSYDILRIDEQELSPEQVESTTWDQPPALIAVLYSVTVQVVIDGEHTIDAHTVQPDIARTLDNLGLELYLGDGISPAPSEPVVDGLVIRINRAVPITLIADGKQIVTRSHGPTVADALAAIGVAPLGEDYTVPPLAARLNANMTVRLVRVTEQLVSERVTVPYSTRYRPNHRLSPGEKQVIRSGVAGENERLYSVRLEDGIEAARTVIEERVILLAEPALIEYGPPDTVTLRP